MAQIVVGVDGSEPSNLALAWARFIGDTTGQVINAINVWHLPTYSGMAFGGTWDPAADAAAILSDAVHTVFGASPPAGLTTTVREGNTAQELLTVSEGASMLILGSRGRGGFEGLLLGSVSASCAEHAGCPVLVVHGANPPPRVPRTAE